MRPFRTLAVSGLLLLSLAAVPAEAAWNNVFQVCCHCRKRPIVEAFFGSPVVAHAAPNPCDPCCRTSYVQRCYYQPVTTYKTECVPVTTYRTSYYYEPVCSYRSSCYYDPCTGSSVQVTTPVTSYRLRSQCNAVTSYVRRCVPVTSYRQVRYWEAVTNCGPTGIVPGAPPVVTEGAPPPGGAPMIPPPNVPATVDEPPVGGTGTNRAFPPPPSLSPKRPMPEAPVRFEHVVSRMVNGGATVSGQVVASNFVTPLRGAKLVFVSKEPRGPQRTVAADAAGRFNVSLAAGGWSIYVSQPNGSMEYHSTINVQSRQNRKVMVVSR